MKNSDRLSDGGVHSHNTHVYAYLAGAGKTRRAGERYLWHLASWTAVTHRQQVRKRLMSQALQDKMKELGVGRVSPR